MNWYFSINIRNHLCFSSIHFRTRFSSGEVSEGQQPQGDSKYFTVFSNFWQFWWFWDTSGHVARHFWPRGRTIVVEISLFREVAQHSIRWRSGSLSEVNRGMPQFAPYCWTHGDSFELQAPVSHFYSTTSRHCSFWPKNSHWLMLSLRSKSRARWSTLCSLRHRFFQKQWTFSQKLVMILIPVSPDKKEIKL